MSKKLSFSIALNLLLDNFKKGADRVKNSFNAMKERANSFASSSKASMLDYSGAADKANESSNRLVSTLAKIGGTAALINLGKQIFNVRSDFQNTEAMFKAFLGSTEKAADYMQEIQKYAFNNVFEFKDLTEQAAQLLAYNNTVEDSIPILDKLSNVAAGVNKPLSQFVELYNKAKSKNKLDSVDIQQWSAMGDVVGYLSDMLGKSTSEIRTMISSGRIGFTEMDQLLTNLTSSGGKFHGMMEEKMKTLGDSYGLLQDSMTSMFNELGEKSEDFLRESVLLGNTLVENYETVGQVLLGLVSTYGVYRVALMASIALEQTRSTLAEKQLTEESMLNVSKLNLAKGSVTYTAAVKAELAVQRQKEIASIKEQGRTARVTMLLLENQLVQQNKLILDAKTIGLSQKKILNLEREAAAIINKTTAAKADYVASIQAMTAKRAEIATNTANTASVNILTLAKNRATAAAIRLRAAILANPLALYAAAALAAGYAIYKLITYKEKLRKVEDEGNKALFKEKELLGNLVTRFNATKKGTEDYNRAKKDLNDKYGESLKAINLEVDALYKNKVNYDLLTKEIEKYTKAKLKNKYIDQFSEENADKVANSYKNILERVKKQIKGVDAGSVFGDIQEFIEQSTITTRGFEFDALFKKYGLKWRDYSEDVYSLLSSKYQFKKNIQELDEIFGNGSVRKKKDKGDVDEVIPTLSDQIKNAKDRVSELRKELANLMSGKTQSEDFARDIENKTKELKEAQDKLGFLTTGKAFSSSEDKALRAAEKRLEAQRKLTAEDRKLQIEKQKFDIDLQQKAIDMLDDSFEKRTKQTLLNLEKANLEIKQKENELLKQQEEYAKIQYEQKHGTSENFGDYYKTLTRDDLQKQMPEGLRPSDIADKVEALTDAAQAAQRKGLTDINKDMSAMLREQEVMYASNLEKRLANTDAYYNAELIKAKAYHTDALAQAAAIEAIEANRAKEKTAIRTDDKLKELDFKEQLELERVAGLESIGMTEFVEEKKLEITKKYLQLRIDALQALADAGNEDAQRQIQLLQASLNTLNAQKPAKSLKGLADKAIFNTIKKGFQAIAKNSDEAGDSAEQAEEKTNALLGSIQSKASTIANVTKELQSVFGGLNEDLDMAMETVGNIAQGFATGGIVGGAMAVIGEGMKLFSKASEAAARHQKALKEIAEARLASQRAYNLLLREQNLLLEEAVSIFGEKKITRAANAINEYRDIMVDIQKEMQGSFRPDAVREQYLEKGASSGGVMGAYFGKQLQDYRKQVDNYNKGINQLAEQKIVTGSQKSGWGFWRKRKDTYSSILDVDRYKKLIKENGELDKAMLETIITTENMDNSTKKYLENILELYNQAEAAQEELRNYLQSTFGVLGDDIMTSLENAIKDRGVNAWEDFGKAGAKVIEQLGKQIAYELFFADKFKKLQEQLEGVYGSGKDEEAIARESMDLVGKFYQGIGKDMELAQGFMENWQKEAEKYGLELWKPDSSTQNSTTGYSVSMDQDTGGAILGRITGIHESILTLTSMVSGITMDTSKSLIFTVSINDELKKHTEIFHEMRDIQTKTLTISKEVKESLDSLGDIKSDLASINKNTRGLISK